MPGSFDRYGKSSSQNVYTAIVESCALRNVDDTDVDDVGGLCCDDIDGSCC